MVLQVYTIGCVWKTPIPKSGHYISTHKYNIKSTKDWYLTLSCQARAQT